MKPTHTQEASYHPPRNIWEMDDKQVAEACIAWLRQNGAKISDYARASYPDRRKAHHGDDKFRIVDGYIEDAK